MHKKPKARVIAFYLPQFHPTPENDKWWGKGFTEWTNVGKATPLFKGHYQPRVPADLGYYDLRLPEVREAQAELAREAGIEGFMYWHYWFGNGRTVLDMPFKQLLKTKKPDFPFCLGWANHSWTNKTWDTKSQYMADKYLIEQLYPGREDFVAHFNYLLPAFCDERYIRIDQKPVFMVYAPKLIPEFQTFVNLWQELAVENGLPGIHFVGQAAWNRDCELIHELGVNSVCRSGIFDAADKVKGRIMNRVTSKIRHHIPIGPLNKFQYKDIIENFSEKFLDEKDWIFPTIIPNFDHSPRSGRKGLIYVNSTPELFEMHTRQVIESVSLKAAENRVIFLRSWNEWAEGNYVEPDLRFGHGYLNALRNSILE